jgi:hypothetical protein
MAIVKKRTLTLWSITAAMLVFASCTKINHDKFIVGEWKRMALGDNEINSITLPPHPVTGEIIVDTAMNEWEFSDDGKVVVKYKDYKYIDRNGVVRIIEKERMWEEGDWSISAKGSDTYVNITGIRDNIDYSGRWRIVKLDAEHLVLHRIENEDGSTDGAFLWREFTRE